MDQLFSVMAIFVGYPVLAAVLGVIFVVLGRRIRRITPVVVGIIWLLYALYETGMKRRWLCTGECNIRIDLLLIYPVLAVTLVAVALSVVWPRSTPRPPA
jgi:hypothetical protein